MLFFFLFSFFAFMLIGENTEAKQDYSSVKSVEKKCIESCFYHPHV